MRSCWLVKLPSVQRKMKDLLEETAAQKSVINTKSNGWGCIMNLFELGTPSMKQIRGLCNGSSSSLTEPQQRKK